MPTRCTGVPRAPTTGSYQSLDGEFRSTPDGALALSDSSAVLDPARPWTGVPLNQYRPPKVTVRT